MTTRSKVYMEISNFTAPVGTSCTADHPGVHLCLIKSPTCSPLMFTYLEYVSAFEEQFSILMGCPEETGIAAT